MASRGHYAASVRDGGKVDVEAYFATRAAMLFCEGFGHRMCTAWRQTEVCGGAHRHATSQACILHDGAVGFRGWEGQRCKSILPVRPTSFINNTTILPLNGYVF